MYKERLKNKLESKVVIVCTSYHIWVHQRVHVSSISKGDA